jgi:hypothetical protein
VPAPPASLKGRFTPFLSLQNEHEVGAAIAQHRAENGGDYVFITSKVSPYDLGYDKCLESVKVRDCSSFCSEIL